MWTLCRFGYPETHRATRANQGSFLTRDIVHARMILIYYDEQFLIYFTQFSFFKMFCMDV